nr:MAG TPA: tail length tape measure protein [Caudoviricetes sp.]
MATIAEELVLYDKFSNTFNRYIKMADQAAGSTNKIEKATKKAESATTGLTGKVQGLAAAYLSVKSVQGIMNLSDTFSQTGARLDMINEKYKTTLDLQTMIMQAANNSRGIYSETADLVAKLGTLASEAFDNPEEIVAFAEQINKQFVIAGTSAVGAQAAMLQLTQALSAGVLRGEELNSVLENAPTIAQTIAEYLGVSTGEMRNLAAEGALTADVVKAALLSAADETNAKFEQMPYTFSQVSNMLVNVALKTFEPFINLIGQGANYIGENIDSLIPVFYGAATAVGVFTAATSLAKVKVIELTLAMLKNPIFWIALVIGVVVGAIYKWVQSMGSAQIAWLTLKDKVLTGLETVQLGFAKFGYKVTSGIRSMVVGIVTIFEGLVNILITGINKLISFANKIPGVAIEALDKVNWSAEVAVDANIRNASDLAAINELEDQINYNRLNREYEIQQLKTDLMANSSEGTFDYDSYAADLSGIKDDTGAIKKSVDMSSEDIKSLVDVATRQYVNRINLTTQTPIINVSGQNTGNTQEDRRALADAIKDIIIEQAAASSYRSTALPV